eukprot:COSAG06_NODE_8204_length_2239_cov_2.454673_2_plen_68_part_00
MPWLRTELRMAMVLRSRPLGPMLTPPAGELGPQFRAFGPAAWLSSAAGLALGLSASDRIVLQNRETL